MGNIVLNKTATAGSSVVPYTPQKAVDGSVTPFSRWLCNATPGWLRVDPGALYMVNRWVVKHMPVAGWGPDYVISDFRLQGSNDNINWSDIDGVAGNTAAVTDRTVTPVVFRYFRVYVTRGLKNNNQMISLMEFELYQAYSSFLTNLTISAGALTPAFNMNTFAYTATVAANVASIQVTPTAQDPQAVIKVNGAVIPSGQPASVNLNYGANTITVNVTDGTSAQKNYVVTVTRLGSANLNTLTMQAGSVNVPLAPAFDKATFAYTAKANYGTTTVTVTPTPEDSAAVVKVNGVVVPGGTPSAPINIAAGANIAVEVTATTGNKQTYTIAASVHTSAWLSVFSVKKGFSVVAFTPPFTPDNLGPYTLNVQTAASVSIQISAEDPAATVLVTCNGTVLTKSGAAYPLSLPTPGNYAVVVTVTSTSGDVKQYTLTITRT
jgi:hypothetical protein